VAELVDARDLKALRLLKGLIFFGKRDLAFGINLPERSEIWKTFFGASDGPYSRHGYGQATVPTEALKTAKIARMLLSPNVRFAPRMDLPARSLLVLHPIGD